MLGCVVTTLLMAEFMSASVAFGESWESRVLRDVLFMVKSGESVKVLWVAFEMNWQAKFQVWELLGDPPSW